MSDTESQVPTIDGWLAAHGLDGWMIDAEQQIEIEWFGDKPLVKIPAMRLMEPEDLAALDAALRATPGIAFVQKWGVR